MTTYLSLEVEYHSLADLPLLKSISDQRHSQVKTTDSSYVSEMVPWQQRFEELKEWKKAKKVDHCRVPFKERPLGGWVSHQRTAYNTGRMPREREELLKSIGFEFKLENRAPTKYKHREVQFQEMYAQAKKFCDEHGHCRITASHGKLGAWARDRRYEFWQGRLDPKRTVLLTKIGFEWDVKPGRLPKDNKYKRAELEQQRISKLIDEQRRSESQSANRPDCSVTNPFSQSGGIGV